MKKILKILCVLFACVCLMTCLACNSEDKGGSFTFTAPDGAPALAVSKFINDNENFDDNNNFTYNVVPASTIGKIMIKGESDFIVMPVNAATKLYNSNKDNAYKMVSVITHGNLFIMTKGEKSLEELKGKIVGVIGQGNVPDLTFKAILNDAQIEYETSEIAIEGKIAIRYFDDASSLIPMLKQGKLTIGLLPEPAATKLTKMDASYATRIDVQELFDSKNKSYPQAVLMAKTSVIESNPNLIKKMQSAFEEGVEWLNNNIETAVSAVNSALVEGVTPSLAASNIDENVIEGCNIFWQSSVDSKSVVENYIEKLIAVNENSAKMPQDDFFM